MHNCIVDTSNKMTSAIRCTSNISQIKLRFPDFQWFWKRILLTANLAIQLSWMDPWLLVKCVCPVHLVERWGCSPGLWLWQSINCLIGFLITAGSIVDISSSSHHCSPASIPQRHQKIILSYCHGNGLCKWWGRLWGSV